MKDLVLDRSQPPRPGLLELFSFPPFSSRRLDNGMRFLWARVPQLPLVGLEVVVPAGSQHDGERPGLATFHAGLLDEGTTAHSALELANRIERLGGYLAAGATWDFAYVSGTFLADSLQEGIDLLSEICRTPSFPEEEVERQRQQRLTEILRSNDLPNTQADLAFSEVVYRGTVYASPLIGSAASIESLRRDDLLDFYQRTFVADGSAVIAVGDFDPDVLQAQIEKGLGDWSNRATPSGRDADLSGRPARRGANPATARSRGNPPISS
jgi:zinc protease